MYKVGDHVVKANTGICKIDSLIKMNLGGTGENEYYTLLPLYDVRSTLYVSIDSDDGTLRAVMTKEEAKKLIKSIPKITPWEVVNDKKREQEYKDVIKANDPGALVGVLKNLYSRGQERIARGKKITTTDDRYYTQIQKILFGELAYALDEEYAKIEKKIKDIIER